MLHRKRYLLPDNTDDDSCVILRSTGTLHSRKMRRLNSGNSRSFVEPNELSDTSNQQLLEN